MTTQKDGLGAYVRPDASHIAIGEANSTYCLPTHLELSSCAKGPGAYYCQNPTLMRTESSCIADLLRNPTTEALERCEIETKAFRETQWTYLENSREWLISTPQPLHLEMICNNGSNYTMNIQGINLIEPVGTCLLITNETVNNRYYLRAVTPNGPVFHYLPNIKLRLKESPQETTTTTAPMKTTLRYSMDRDDLLDQIKQLKVALYGLFTYTAILSLVTLTYLLSKIRRRHEHDNAGEPLVTTEENTPSYSKTSPPESPLPTVPPPMPIIKSKRVDFNLSPARIRQKNPTHLESIV